MIRIVILWLYLFLSSVFTSKAQSFLCTGDFLLVTSPDLIDGQLYEVSLANAADSILFLPFTSKTGEYINAIGYSRTDDVIYGIQPRTQTLYKIEANGEATFLKELSDLEFGHHYIAGDVTPDGKQLILQGGGDTSDLDTGDTELVYVDLRPPYGTRIVPIETSSGFPLRCADIAFDPITGELFGFDGLNGRLVNIDPATADIDDTSHPVVGVSNAMASLFFDAFGNLYGYGRHVDSMNLNTLFELDKRTGRIQIISNGPTAPGNDGCACPYTVELQKSVLPRTVFPCSEVVYTFSIANSSKNLLEGIDFEDEFPNGFSILEILNNPFGGHVEGIGTNELFISNMNIPTGIDSFHVKVIIDQVEPGIYNNQATLDKLPINLGGFRLSDDPTTPISDDSTALLVQDLAIDISEQVFGICIGDTLFLDATIAGEPQYEWSTGSNDPIIPITEGGTYWVEISSPCETYRDTTIVQTLGRGATVDVGEDRTILLGESITLQADIQVAGTYNYFWSETPGVSLVCPTCLSPTASPIHSSTFLLEMWDEDGCRAADELQVFVDNSPRVYVPNSFSPNGDAINDWFFIQGIEGTKINSFQIYSRWGELLFKNNDFYINSALEGWNGMVKNEKAGIGVYVWTAELEFLDGKTQLMSGDVTLVR